jgi:hypothetical protein
MPAYKSIYNPPGKHKIQPIGTANDNTHYYYRSTGDKNLDGVCAHPPQYSNILRNHERKKCKNINGNLDDLPFILCTGDNE